MCTVYLAQLSKICSWLDSIFLDVQNCSQPLPVWSNIPSSSRRFRSLLVLVLKHSYNLLTQIMIPTVKSNLFPFSAHHLSHQSQISQNRPRTTDGPTDTEQFRSLHFSFSSPTYEYMHSTFGSMGHNSDHCIGFCYHDTPYFHFRVIFLHIQFINVSTSIELTIKQSF